MREGKEMALYTTPQHATKFFHEDIELIRYLHEIEKQAEINLVIFSIGIFIAFILCTIFWNDISNFFKTRMKTKIQRIGFILFIISILLFILSICLYCFYIKNYNGPFFYKLFNFNPFLTLYKNKLFSILFKISICLAPLSLLLLSKKVNKTLSWIKYGK